MIRDVAMLNFKTEHTVPTDRTAEDRLPEYKRRMIIEYEQLKERYDKLDEMTIKAEAGTLCFPLNCPLDLLLEQKKHMGCYLRCLKIRAEIEGIVLP